MSVVIKSQAKATNEFRMLEDGKMKSIMIQPGRNVVDESVYENLKEHSGFVSFINRDVITINTEGKTARKPSKEPDFVYVESLAGNEDGKDVIKEYALQWNIKLNKKNTVENMITTFMDEYKEQ